MKNILEERKRIISYFSLLMIVYVIKSGSELSIYSFRFIVHVICNGGSCIIDLKCSLIYLSWILELCHAIIRKCFVWHLLALDVSKNCHAIISFYK